MEEIVGGMFASVFIDCDLPCCLYCWAVYILSSQC